MKKREWLITARKEKELNQSEFAKQMGIAKSYLSAIESGERTPSGFTALKIARALDLPMERFYEDQEDAREKVLEK